MQRVAALLTIGTAAAQAANVQQRTALLLAVSMTLGTTSAHGNLLKATVQHLTNTAIVCSYNSNNQECSGGTTKMRKLTGNRCPL